MFGREAKIFFNSVEVSRVFYVFVVWMETGCRKSTTHFSFSVRKKEHLEAYGRPSSWMALRATIYSGAASGCLKLIFPNGKRFPNCWISAPWVEGKYVRGCPPLMIIVGRYYVKLQVRRQFGATWDRLSKSCWEYKKMYLGFWFISRIYTYELGYRILMY